MFLMRGTLRATIVLALLISAPAWAAGGYVHEAVGEVSIASGKNAPLPAARNHAISSNTLISTGDKSHAILKFEDGQVVAMQANTVFNVREYRFEPKKIEKSNILFTNLKGGLLFITGLIGQRSKKSFRLTTPNATIGVRGTEFMAVMVDDVLYGKVVSGSISMTNGAGVVTFEAGQTILASSPSTLPLAIPAENLPAGIFSQLEALQLPLAEPGPVPAPAVEGASLGSTLADTASIITGGALLSAAAAVAGGAVVATPTVAPTAVFPTAPGGAALPPVMIPAASAGAVAAQPPVAALSVVATAVPVAATATGAAVPAPGNAAPLAIVLPSAWYDDTIPPSGLIPAAGSAASATLADKSASGDPSLFGRHNFTPGRVATGEICVFCHTPQGSEEEVAAPLWNRTQSPMSEYKAYSSIGSATAAATGSVSIACLSCHDGTQAPNVIINSPPSYSDFGVYPEGLTPFQISSKKYLKDHHPVSMLFGGGGMSDNQPNAPVDVLTSFTNADYDAAAVRKLTGRADATSRDFQFKDSRPGEGEPGLFNRQDFNKAEHSGSGSSTVWWLESRGTGKGRQKSDFYLYTRTDTVDGLAINRPYVECASCHDPHSPNPTFLRVKNVGSTVCMTCHNK